MRRPEFRQDENFLSILWRKGADATESAANQVTGQETGQETGQVKSTVQRIVLAIGSQTLTRKNIMEKMSLKGRDNFRIVYLEPSISDGYVTKLYPDSTKRRDQAYYLTGKGLELFAILKKGK